MAPPTRGAAGPDARASGLALFTDRYELAMLQGYHETGHDPLATFDLYFRSLPTDRGYVVAAGLEQALDYVLTLSFDDEELAFLDSLGFSESFLEFLAAFEFTGEIRAVPEGTVVFPDEPLVEVTAPISQAQLFETLLLNQVGYQSLVATKAARMRDTVDRLGDGQALVDFGSRRAHGTDAGLKAVRAAYIGGFDATSNVEAGWRFDVPTAGTMAHSWVQSFPTEREAFEAFLDVYGEDSVLLVDTYDTVGGARTAASVAAERELDIEGVRLDSGDLVGLSKTVSEIVDCGIFVSSGMDEYSIESFLNGGGVATGFGPGTALVTSEDAPTLNMVYKLVAVEQDGDLVPSMKLSPGKATYPWQKSVRRVERDGRFHRDVLALRDEAGRGDEQLRVVVEDGEWVGESPSLATCRERTLGQLTRLPARFRALRRPASYQVRPSDGLQEMTGALREELERQYLRDE
ncbi:nicotinate phosphoribosyltransferase [Haloarchaeobius litoreus]|uniref:nicotinate phosphoribosyltransferase n=1 Tax=Haloarchaeobius litoreus TaxID=755306 RepID=A0ABD6DP92_9EURY|nr:nicotinate phosphoribosyltransferase [Haloarchaeobius litoreus]